MAAIGQCQGIGYIVLLLVMYRILIHESKGIYIRSVQM